MKRNSQYSSGKKLRGLFCTGLAAAMLAAIALNGAAANATPVQYDTEVRSSFTHTAALSGGELYCWGSNDEGQFPGYNMDYSSEPVQLLSGVQDVAVSENRTLVVDSDGALRAFGLDPCTGRSYEKDGTLIAGDAAQVEAGPDFAAYISKGGALYAWGSNAQNQLGNGRDRLAEKPVKLFDSGVQKVSLGTGFAFALMEDGSVYSWGANEFCQTGNWDSEVPSTLISKPVQVAEDAQDISVGSRHACILKNDGSLWICGDNTYSQVGVENSDSYFPLTKVLDGIRSVSAGYLHNLAISNDGTVYSWGYGLSGQLGTGNEQRQWTPTATAFDYVQIFACHNNTFAITPNGYVRSFGDNTNYRLGKDNGSDSLVPMTILDKDMNWVYPEFAKDKTEDTDPNQPPQPLPGHDDTAGPVETDDDPQPKSNGFIDGYEDGTFKPDNPVTRAEFVKMLVSALCDDFDPNENYGTTSFADIPLNMWYENYVAYAQQNQLIDGYKDGTFRPNNPISRAEAAKITASILGLNLETAPDANYSDVPADNWAALSINALTQNGALSGDGHGRFRPNDNITRAEAAKVIVSVLNFRPTESERQEIAENQPNSPFGDVSNKAWYYAYLLRAVGYVE